MTSAKSRPFCLGDDMLMTFLRFYRVFHTMRVCMAYSTLASSQRETSLQSNAVSHWLGASLDLALESVCIVSRAVARLTHRESLLSCNNTLGPEQHGRHLTDDIFKCTYIKVNVLCIILIQISLKFVPMGLRLAGCKARLLQWNDLSK